MASARLTICNLALARIAAKPIQSLTENSTEADECNRLYPQVLSRALEGQHDWSFAIRRVRLAAKANDRSAEWLHAYQVPSDMASAMSVLPDLSAAGIAVPVPIAGEPYAERWAGRGGDYGAPYVIVDDTIYTNAADATLEFTTNTIEGARIGSLLEMALALDLASWLAVAVMKEQKLRGEIAAEAEVAMERAIADDLNRHPQMWPAYVSEVARVRAG